MGERASVHLSRGRANLGCAVRGRANLGYAVRGCAVCGCAVCGCAGAAAARHEARRGKTPCGRRQSLPISANLGDSSRLLSDLAIGSLVEALCALTVEQLTHLSANLAQPRPTSPNLAQPRPISPNLAQPRPISPDLARSRPTSPNLGSSRLLSLAWRNFSSTAAEMADLFSFSTYPSKTAVLSSCSARSRSCSLDPFCRNSPVRERRERGGGASRAAWPCNRRRSSQPRSPSAGRRPVHTSRDSPRFAEIYRDLPRFAEIRGEARPQTTGSACARRRARPRRTSPRRAPRLRLPPRPSCAPLTWRAESDLW